MEFIKEFVTKSNIITVFTVIFTVVYAITAFYLLNRITARKAKRKSEFFETAIQGLIDGTIESTNDLINVYKGVTNLSSDDLTYRYGLNKWLREILAQVIGRKIGSQLDKQGVLELKNKINAFIEANEKNSPFSDLPDTERSILSDLSSYSNNGGRISVNRKISELSSVIQARYEEQKN